MAGNLLPEEVLKSLDKGVLAPLYLFYGPDEFRREKVLDRIRNNFIPETSRDFNIEIFYGGETNPEEIISRARSLPFMAPSRLSIVRRIENYSKDSLNKFLPYIESPVETTCLIFISSKTDFKIKFYKTFKSAGMAVNFSALTESQATSWIKRMAAEIGLNIEGQACAYLQQIVGNSTRNLYGELEKLHLRHLDKTVGVNEVKALVIHSRMYTIFELMNLISLKKRSDALAVLNRFLEEEDKRSGPLRLIGMLNRQIRFLWLTKGIMEKGGRTGEVSKKLGLPHFSAREFAKQSRLWSAQELERGLSLLYRADGRLKSGSRPGPILETLLISLFSNGSL